MQIRRRRCLPVHEARSDRAQLRWSGRGYVNGGETLHERVYVGIHKEFRIGERTARGQTGGHTSRGQKRSTKRNNAGGWTRARKRHDWR